MSTMFMEEDEVEVLGTSATDRYVVRHMVGGRSDMLWLDARHAFTSDHTQAKVLSEAEARIAAEGCRVTYKNQEGYVFDVVAEGMVATILKAAEMSIVSEREAREAMAVPTVPGGTAPVGLYEGYEDEVRRGNYAVDSDGYYEDEEGSHIGDDDFEGGYARRGHHKRDPASPGNRPKDPNKFDVKAGLDSFEAVTSAAWSAEYADVERVLGCAHTHDGDGWHVSTCWWVEFHDGEKARVTDWDQSSTYDDELPEPKAIRSGTPIFWRIEGSPDGVKRIMEMLKA